MAPLFALISLFGILSVPGALGIPFVFGWWTALRIALAGMFFLTASAHWGKRRPDLIRMVPPVFRRPELLVSLTGVLEAVGAVALMIPVVAPYAALGLCMMLLAIFPANVHAAQRGLTIAGSPVLPIVPRALMQAVFIAATIAVFCGRPR